MPKLYLGDIVISQNKDFLRFAEIELVVNCTHAAPMPTTSSPIETIRISINDDPSDMELMFNYLQNSDVLERIHRAITSNKNVFVHCIAGRQRSASIVAGYLMKYHHKTLRESISFIQCKRPHAFSPNITFLDALTEFESN